MVSVSIHGRSGHDGDVLLRTFTPDGLFVNLATQHTIFEFCIDRDIVVRDTVVSQLVKIGVLSKTRGQFLILRY